MAKVTFEIEDTVNAEGDDGILVDVKFDPEPPSMDDLTNAQAVGHRMIEMIMENSQAVTFDDESDAPIPADPGTNLQ